MRKMRFLISMMSMLFPLLGMGETSTRVFENFNASHGLADNSAHTITCTKTGRLVITTMGQINFFDGQQFSYIDPSEENLYPLQNYKGNYHLYFDKYHHMWLKNTHNVTCVNLLTEKFVASVDEVFAEFGQTKKVTDMFVSGDGITWLLSEDGLFSVATKKNLKIRTDLNLQDLETYKDHFLLLFYENSLVEIYDLNSEKIVYSGKAYDQADVQKYNHSSVLFVKDNLIYQLRNGAKEALLLCFDIDKYQWSTLLKTPYHLNNIASLDSLLYLSSEYGYWVYDMKTSHSVHIEKLRLSNGQDLETDINVMAFDRQGGLWAGTQHRGLLYSRPFNSPFNVYHWSDKRTGPYYAMMDGRETETQFRGKSVNCVFRDSRGWNWVGTSQGLLLYRHNSDKLPQVITKNDGLYNNVIHSIVEDHLHHIWVATSYGISCVEVSGDNLGFVNSYNQYDYIPNETFVNNHALCLSDGTIVMQSLDHIITFNPEQMQTLKKETDFEIYPKLIKMLVNGIDVKTGQEVDGNMILERALTRTKEIDLNYNQNSIVLTFSSLNYFRPQQTYYRIRIKGLNDDWQILTPYSSHGLVDSRGQLHLPMMRLQPGTYIIELQTSMRPDKWDTTPYEWIVNVNEPWWRTTGVFALFGLLLLILLVINGYYYLRNTNMRATRNSEEVNLLKRIRSFAERCGNNAKELLEPSPEEINGVLVDPQNEISQEFIQVMAKIMPFVLSKKTSQITMRILSEEAGMDVQQFYSIITSNIYKNPRPLARTIMLKRAEELLKTKAKPIDEIAEECGFVSANYFIAAFYRNYRKTPIEYRGRQ